MDKELDHQVTFTIFGFRFTSDPLLKLAAEDLLRILYESDGKHEIEDGRVEPIGEGETP